MITLHFERSNICDSYQVLLGKSWNLWSSCCWDRRAWKGSDWP